MLGWSRLLFSRGPVWKNGRGINFVFLPPLAVIQEFRLHSTRRRGRGNLHEDMAVESIRKNFLLSLWYQHISLSPERPSLSLSCLISLFSFLVRPFAFFAFCFFFAKAPWTPPRWYSANNLLLLQLLLVMDKSNATVLSGSGPRPRFSPPKAGQ